MNADELPPAYFLIEEEPEAPIKMILVHLSVPDHEILGYYTEGDDFTGVLPPDALLHQISSALHTEAVLSNATHMQLEPEVRVYRQETAVATGGERTTQDKLAALGLTVEELSQALLA